MNLLDFTREPITPQDHIAAVVIGVISAVIYAFVINERSGILRSALAGFWVSCAFYSYSFAAGVRYRQVQSIPITVAGVIIGALILKFCL
jgi:hypothetical protein